MNTENKYCLEYVWIDRNGHYRSKTRVVNYEVNDRGHAPEWNFDGSSTDQIEEYMDAYGERIDHSDNTEIKLVPVAIFKDPFRNRTRDRIVLCECYNVDDTPLACNYRYFAVQQAFRFKKNTKPWFGMEQEYFIIDPNTKMPLGYHATKKQGNFYCGVGTENAYGRHLAEYHMKICLRAGVRICGINAEVAPGQWEFQIGTCEGVSIGDHMHIARYLLYRSAELFHVMVSLHPKPLSGNKWNGSGCHTNFSTVEMREGDEQHDGYHYIEEAIRNLNHAHNIMIKYYGKDNEQRLTGKCETSSLTEFTWGVGTRNTSIRIPNNTFNDMCGYFEDRRPSSNCDPYLVAHKLYFYAILNDVGCSD